MAMFAPAAQGGIRNLAMFATTAHHVGWQLWTWRTKNVHLSKNMAEGKVVPKSMGWRALDKGLADSSVCCSARCHYGKVEWHLVVRQR